jgi:hypothetical protein
MSKNLTVVDVIKRAAGLWELPVKKLLNHQTRNKEVWDPKSAIVTASITLGFKYDEIKIALSDKSNRSISDRKKRHWRRYQNDVVYKNKFDQLTTEMGNDTKKK